MRAVAAALALCALVPATGAAGSVGARVARALTAALADPGTWAPAAGAVAVNMADRDHAISTWAVEHTPVFGSRKGALDASDVLRDLSHVGMLATTPLVPARGAPFYTWAVTALVEHVGLVGAAGTTSVIKEQVGRVRPDGSDDLSFPSGHATRAFATQAAAARNLAASTLPAPARIGIDAAIRATAVGTAWARIEGGAHYPSDVLAGAAIGNFCTRFFAEAILPETPGAMSVRPGAHGLPGVTVTVRF